jgi:hypothetical protein
LDLSRFSARSSALSRSSAEALDFIEQKPMKSDRPANEQAPGPATRP